MIRSKLLLTPSRIAELVFVALIMALLTLFIGDLPELEVVESTINDDGFTDLVIRTRGELPIDTNIVILTYGPEILDEEEMVSRELLAQSLLALMELEPKAVAVDFLLEEERSEVGDQMLTDLFSFFPDNLLIGVFREDSLDKFRLPPSVFGLKESQLGAVNLMPGDDKVIRHFRYSWNTTDGTEITSFAVKAAQLLNPKAVEELESREKERYIIDYAGGMGEHIGERETEGVQVFPSLGLLELRDALFNGDEDVVEAYRTLVAGKLVLVGYGDLRRTQVKTVVDRFYTPLKPAKNSLPDMHGVAIHANIVNTIVTGRIIADVPSWINVLWGTLIVFIMYYGYELCQKIRSIRLRTVLIYGGWVLLLIAAVTIPITLFRITTLKLSVYTPFAGVVLGRIALAAFDKVKRIVRDYWFRRRLHRPIPPGLRIELQSILKIASARERYIQSLFWLHRTFHTCADRVFSEAMTSNFAFSRATVGSPTALRLKTELANLDVDTVSRGVVLSKEIIDLILENHVLRRGLRLARSIAIAVNEINRQNAVLDEEEKLEWVEQEKHDEPGSTTEGVIAALSSDGDGDDYEQFVLYWHEIDALVGKIAALVHMDDGQFEPVSATELLNESTKPFIVKEMCETHGEHEVFVFVSEQEDANNKDDFYDLIYAGNTIHCRAAKHPGLTQFREEVSNSSVVASSEC